MITYFVLRQEHAQELTSFLSSFWSGAVRSQQRRRGKVQIYCISLFKDQCSLCAAINIIYFTITHKHTHAKIARGEANRMEVHRVKGVVKNGVNTFCTLHIASMAWITIYNRTRKKKKAKNNTLNNACEQMLCGLWLKMSGRACWLRRLRRSKNSKRYDETCGRVMNDEGKATLCAIENSEKYVRW